MAKSTYYHKSSLSQYYIIINVDCFLNSPDTSGQLALKENS